GANHEDDVRFRVIADHVRSAMMLIGDGVAPGNESRGYIVRRLLRRAVRSVRLLGYEDPVLPALLPVTMDKMKASYPELETGFARIEKIAYGEEELFRQTLVHGTQIFDLAATSAKTSGRTTLSGDEAFKLHDTFGFPIDLTLEMASEQGLSVDEAGFRSLMNEQRTRAKADAKSKKGQHANTTVYREALDELGATDWRALDSLREEAHVQRLVSAEGTQAEAGEGEIVEVVLNRSPFYAESGGQSSDSGELVWDGGRAEVLDVQRPLNGLIIHQVRVLDGTLRAGIDVDAHVDEEWRRGATQAHSATHLIGAALRENLGPTATQSGSFNRPGFLRLDFGWNASLTPEQIALVEQEANAVIRQDFPVMTALMPKAEAIALGAQALFGERYPDIVRVVEIDGAWSRELCGGTHVASTAQIGTMVLTHEGSVSAGNRRVEMVTGLEGFQYLARERDLVRQLSEMLKTPSAELPGRVTDLVDRLRAADKEIERIKAQQLLAGAGSFVDEAKDLGGVSFVGRRVDGAGGGDVRTLALDVRGKFAADRPAVVVLIGVVDGKPAAVAALNQAAQDKGLSAHKLIQAMGQHIGGRGGGKADIAQGGGTDPSGIEAALAAAAAEVSGA
ncbi:MAG: alanine--tRNA ligase, partial [Nocardioidaceae bacterium]|nr:alanine--tRNA ligase [Nocardioidaceae bacterium]